jgi:hypothetical protein
MIATMPASLHLRSSTSAVRSHSGMGMSRATNRE